MQNLNVDDMLNPFLIPTNEIDQPTTEKLEVILKDQFGYPFVVNDFTVIEIRNQSAHGNALQGKREAYSTVDELFLKNKLLLQIVSPSLNWD